MPGLRDQQIADSARSGGLDPEKALRDEEIRQGYRLGKTPPPPQRYSATGQPLRTEEQEERVREKARAGRMISQEDL